MATELSSTDQRIRDQIRERLSQMHPRPTQLELAKKLGIKQPSVSELMNGRRGQIPQSLVDLLDLLGLEVVLQRKNQ